MSNRSVSSGEIVHFLGERASGFGVDLDTEILVSGVSPLTPGRPGCFSFCTGHDELWATAVDTSASALILVPRVDLEQYGLQNRRHLISVENPRREYARVVAHYFTEPAPVGVSPAAHIDDSAIIGSRTTVGPGAVVSAGVMVGDDCTIGANVVLMPNTELGHHTLIGPNSTIGYTGFGYEREDDGTPLLVPQLGRVRIGSHVEIGANVTIDCGTIDDTVIEDHVKIDNLTHIAHNCHVHQAAIICAAACIAGRVVIGQRAWIAPNATILQKVHVGEGATVGLGATVLRNVEAGTTVVGTPARKINR